MVQQVTGNPILNMSSNSIYLLDVQAHGGATGYSGGELFPSSKIHGDVERAQPSVRAFYDLNARFFAIGGGTILPILLPSGFNSYVVLIASTRIDNTHSQTWFDTGLTRLKAWLQSSFNGGYVQPYWGVDYSYQVTDFNTLDIRIHADYGKLSGAIQSNIISSLDTAFNSTTLVQMYS